MILTAVTALAVIGCYWTMTTPDQSENIEHQTRALVFPTLHNQIDEISRIEIVRDGNTFSLMRENRIWRNDGIGGYPAKKELLESVLTGLAGLRYLEPKTERTSLYYRLDLDEPDKGSRATRLTLYRGQSEIAADIVIGKIKENASLDGKPGVYVRVINDQRAWLVEGSVNAHVDAPGWSENSIIDIHADSIVSLTFREKGSEAIELAHGDNANATLELQGKLSAGTQAQTHQIKFLAQMFEDLRFVDSRATSESPASTRFEAIVVTKEPLQVVLRADQIEPDGTVWVNVSATAPGSPVATAQSEELAAAINRRFKGWQLKLPRTAGDRLKLRRDDLIAKN